jgi:ribosomal protein L17
VDKQKADLQRQIEATKQAARDAMARNPIAMGGKVSLSATPKSQAADAKAKELQDQLDALTDTAKNAVDKAKQQVVAARNGDMAAYDWLLANTTGDVHDQLAAADPRKAGLKSLAKDRAVNQIKDAIGNFVNPIVTGMKDRNAAAKQGIDQAKAIDRQQDAAGKDAGNVADDRAKAIKDAQKAARRIVKDKPEMLPKQDLMDYSVNSQQDLDALRQQAAGMADQIDQGSAQGFDMTPLRNEFARIQSAISRQQSQFNAMRMQLSNGMGGQQGGGQFSATPMFQGGGW